MERSEKLQLSVMIEDTGSLEIFNPQLKEPLQSERTVKLDWQQATQRRCADFIKEAVVVESGWILVDRTVILCQPG